MKICIFGSASDDIREIYRVETEKLAEELARRGHGLIFGGGSSGAMGAAARGFARQGGEIVGVAPLFFSGDGILFDRCTRMIRTETLHERKQRMEELSDAFVVAPGGIGTMDEFFEAFTLKNLGRHRKPLVILNVEGCYDRLLAFLDDLAGERLMRGEAKTLFSVCRDAGEAIRSLDFSFSQV